MDAPDQPRPRDPVMAANIRTLEATAKRTYRDAHALKAQLLIHLQKRSAIYQQMGAWMEMSRHQLRPDPVNLPYALAQQQQRGAVLQQLRDATTCCKSFDGKLLRRELYKSKNLFNVKVANSNCLLEEDLENILLKNDTTSSSVHGEQAVLEEATTPNGSPDTSGPSHIENKDEQQKETGSSISFSTCSAATPAAHSPMEPAIAPSFKGKVSSIVNKLEADNSTTSLPPPELTVSEKETTTGTRVSNIIAMFGEAASTQPKTTPLPDICVPKGRVASIRESLSEKSKAKPATLKSFASRVIPKGNVSVTAKKFETNTETAIGTSSSSTCSPTVVLKGKVAMATTMFENITESTPTPAELKSKRAVNTAPSASPPRVVKMVAMFEEKVEDNTTPSVTLESAETTAYTLLAEATEKLKETVPVCTSSGLSDISVNREIVPEQTPVPEDDQDTVTCTEAASSKPAEGSSGAASSKPTEGSTGKVERCCSEPHTDSLETPEPQVSQAVNEGSISPRAPPRRRKNRRKNRRQRK